MSSVNGNSIEVDGALDARIKFDGRVRVLVFDWIVRKALLFEVDGRNGIVSMCEESVAMPDLMKLKNITWYELPRCGTFPLVCVLKCDNIYGPIVFRMETLTDAEQYHLLPRQIPSPVSIHNWHTTAQMLMWQQAMAESDENRPSSLPPPTILTLFIHGCVVYDRRGNIYEYALDPNHYWLS